jgi:hypothetical protein
MKKLFILLLITIAFTAYSQPQSFSKLYNPYNKQLTSSLGASIQKKGNGYVTVSGGKDSTYGNLSVIYKMNIIFNEMDSAGNLIKTTTFEGDSCDYWCGSLGSFIATRNGGYCLAGSISTRGDEFTIDHYIIRFDSNMDTLWTKVFDNDTIEEFMRQVCETSDNGFVFTGQRVTSATHSDIFLFKTDSLGNKLWERTINMGYISSAFNIKETPDRGLLISGYKGWYSQGIGDPFIIKTDSMGNVLWHRFMGNPLQYDGPSGIEIAKDGNYIFAFGYSTHTFPNNDGYLSQLNVMKLNPDGYTIWDRKYDTIRFRMNAIAIQNLSDSNFVVLGLHQLDNIVNNFNYMYWVTYLTKINLNGDSIWRRTYSYTTDKNSENNLLDMVLNNDGGITAIGFVRADTLVPYEKIWLVKTDSNGYAPGCSPTGIEEYYYRQKGELQIYPNPATTQTTITYLQLNKESQLQIYNMLGQIVYEEKLSKGSSQTTLNTTGYKPGLYKVVVGESSGTLIVN